MLPFHQVPSLRRSQIDAITAQDVLLDSGLSGPYDLKTSLSLHFDQALNLDDLFPNDLADCQLRLALEQALASDLAAAHLNRFFAREPHSPVAPDECTYFLQTLVKRGLPKALSDPPATITPYRACSLAQTLWAKGLCHKRRDAFVMAALLLLADLSTTPPPPLPAMPALELDGYLDLNVLVRHLLPAPLGRSQGDQLFEALEADVYFQGARYRAPTQRELQAGLVPNQYGKVLLPGAALNAPASQALDALLQSEAFDRWALRLSEAIQLGSNPHSRALAEQAIADTLYPPEDRRPGYLLDFELFNAHNTLLPFPQIRLDLVNSVQASLGCQPAVAELAGELLMRRFAPELLLDGQPTNSPYRPDLDWAALRQGAMLLRARQLPGSFEQAFQMNIETPADDSTANEALRDTLSHWGPLHGHIDSLPPWSALQWQKVYDHYLNAWDMEAIEQRPNRMTEAALRLKAKGIDPAGRNIDGQLHLEAYVDDRVGYANRGLENITAWYEREFDSWEATAKVRYQGLLQRLIRHLPAEQREQLGQAHWTCYAATWPRYHGPEPVPPYGDSPQDLWHEEIGTRGMFIRVHDPERDTLLELFPERLAYRVWYSAPKAFEQLAGRMNLSYLDYNGAAPTWDVANHYCTLKHLGEAPETAKLDALAGIYATAVALGNRAALHLAGKGATAYERFLAEKRKVSDWAYLWKLIKNTVPLVACVDVKDSEDAASCALDVLGGVGTLTGNALRTASSLSRIFGSNKLAAKVARTTLETIAKRWALSSELPPALYQRTIGLRRWHSAPELTHPGEWPDTFVLDRMPPPGLTPGQLILDRLPPADLSLAWGTAQRPITISRADNLIDVIINGEAYRYQPSDKSNVLQRVANSTFQTNPQVLKTPYSGPHESTIALLFKPDEVNAGTPLFGQHASRAFLTTRLEPAPIRARDVVVGKLALAQVMVHEGKVLEYINSVRVLPKLRAEVSLGVITPPIYHRSITVDPLAEFWFGLPEDTPRLNVEILARFAPPVRLGGLARTIADRRIIRAALIEWMEAEWLVVEADTGVFYATRHEPWRWQLRQLEQVLDNTIGPEARPMPPRDQRRILSRVRDPDLIQRYLDLSESYRIVATRSNLQRDVDNLTALLRDWLEHGRTLRPVRMSPFQELLDAAEARMLPEFAKNILTNSQAQDALTGVMKSGLVGLNREIIPTWRPLIQATVSEQAHTNHILNRLLPASGTPKSFTPMTVDQLLSDSGARSLREHLPGANLAFFTVALEDGRRRVYYSLSGGKSKRIFKIATPPPDENLNITFINALERMEGRAPSPRFTELPILRRPTALDVQQHHRHLDSERLIATVICEDLLARPEQVRSIQVFTLFSTCRSCGGYVLPRLRLDFDKAAFSVSWLVDYRE